MYYTVYGTMINGTDWRWCGEAADPFEAHKLAEAAVLKQWGTATVIKHITNPHTWAYSPGLYVYSEKRQCMVPAEEEQGD